jgi:hypothetical protein
LQNHFIDYQVSSNLNSLNFLTKINMSPSGSDR